MEGTFGKDDRGELHPRQVPGITDAVKTTLSANLGCALLRDGGLQCWGSADAIVDPQHGDDPMEGPLRARDTAGIVDLSSTFGELSAVQSDGTVKMWESMTHIHYFAVGTPRPEGFCVDCVLPGITRARRVSAGGHTHCVLTAEGKVACWGDNAFGQLGTGAQKETPEGTLASRVPVFIDGMVGAKDISVYFHVCAVLQDDRVACWGKNDEGQVGDGTKESRSRPIPVAGLEGAKQVATGEAHSCALLASGTVQCWGSNKSGQLGDGTKDGRLRPVQVRDLVDATFIAAGGDGSCAIRSRGEVVCWGQYLSLGDDTREDRPEPGAVKL